jgi:hypothetical protein
MRIFTGTLIGAALAATLATALMAGGSAGAAPETAIGVDMVDAAKSIQAGCVKRGEDSRVCSCSVGLAYAELDPKVFKLVPQIDPLLEQKNQLIAVTSLVSLASKNGVGVSELQTAYDTIRANRSVVRQICKPLAPAKKAG